MIVVHFLPDGAIFPISPPGLYKSSDSIADIDECGIRNGGCADKCVNKPGSYQCACRSGYKLADDKLTCSGIASTVRYLDSEFFLTD